MGDHGDMPTSVCFAPLCALVVCSPSPGRRYRYPTPFSPSFFCLTLPLTPLPPPPHTPQVVTTSSQPVGALREAARVRELLEQLAALEAAGGTQPPGGSAEWQAAASRLKQHMQTLAAAVSHTVRRAPGQQQEPGDQAGDSVTRPLQALSNAILQDNSSSSSSEQASKLAGAAIASIDRRYDADYIAARASGRRDMYADATNSRADTTNTTHSSSSGGGGGSSQAAAAAGAQGPTSAWRARREAALEAVTAAWGALAAARPGSGERAARVLRLKQVLETYTDVTRYPRWVCGLGGGAERDFGRTVSLKVSTRNSPHASHVPTCTPPSLVLTPQPPLTASSTPNLKPHPLLLPPSGRASQLVSLL